jgi:hypothetical protein
MLPGVEGEGAQEAGGSPARSRHCDRGANPKLSATVAGGTGRREGQGRAGIRKPGDWFFARKPGWGADPGGGSLLEGNSLERRISLGEMPLWSWMVMALLLALLFVLLSASGELLVPLLGQAAALTDYLHEFAHDGRHLLGVPCH